MRLGATLVHLSDGPQFPTVAWARTLEAAGFQSLWTPEIIGRGQLVPDPFVTLAAAAAATHDIELGTATIQVPLHHPVELAHRMLSLGAVCGDRLSLGVSPGSTAADYGVLDREYVERFRSFRRDIGRLRRLLDDGRDDRVVVAAAGAATPLLLGSWGANVERAAREFDGWLASGLRVSVDDIISAHDRYRAAGGGRAVVCAIRVDSRDNLAATARALRRYAASGFDEAVVMIGPNGPPPEAVRALW